MGPHVETALHSHRGFHQHDRQRSLVDWSGLGSPQHVARFLHIRYIYNNAFETLPGDQADGIVRSSGMLDVDFQIAKNPAQDAHRLFVGTQQ